MFNFRKRPTAWAVLISLLLFSPALFAADFTFNVPVKFTNLHEDISRGSVICEISELNAPLFIAGLGLDSHYIPFVVTDGSVEEIFTVSIHIPDLLYTLDRNRWQCRTVLCDNRLNVCGILTPNNEISSLRSAPDSNVVMEYSGSF